MTLDARLDLPPRDVAGDRVAEGRCDQPRVTPRRFRRRNTASCPK